MSKFQNSFEIPDSILKDTKKLNEFLEQAYNSFCVNYFNQIKDLIGFTQVIGEKEKPAENRKAQIVIFTADDVKIKVKDEVKKHGGNISKSEDLPKYVKNNIPTTMTQLENSINKEVK
jgi:hypothetical protein